MPDQLYLVLSVQEHGASGVVLVLIIYSQIPPSKETVCSPNFDGAGLRFHVHAHCEAATRD